MTPDYYLCDKCKKGKVEKGNRVRLHDGHNNLGEPECKLVDLCPMCMAVCFQLNIGAKVCRSWINR